jgi:hypothetical protein
VAMKGAPLQISQEARRAFARRTVADAFERNPRHTWTRESLASWYSIPLSVVEQAIAELLFSGEIVPEDDGYRFAALAAAEL